MNSKVLAALAVVVLTSIAGAQESSPPRFARKPAVTDAGEQIKIEFAADAETDVSVSILDAGGKAVRHLAAGMLGKNAPAPLKSGTLEQELLWDRKDDAGKPAQNGPFQVRVTLGLTPVFDANMFDEPQRFSSLHAIAAGPGGELYTRGSQGDGGWGPESDYRVFGRDGKYLRTIAPFPGNLAYERVAGFGAFKEEDGKSYVPQIHQINHYCFYPAKMGEIRTTQMAVDPEGRLFFISGNNYMESLCVIDKDGGEPAGWSFTGKGIHDPKHGIGRGGFVALSSDNARVYLSGCPATKGNRTYPAVFWTDAKERGALQVLCGDYDKEGSGTEGLKEPRGLAADGQGHLLVADAGNDRIAVVNEQSGKIEDSFAVPGPCAVQVDRSTGAVYVLTYDKKKRDTSLIKFSNAKEHKEVCRLAVGGGSKFTPFLAVSPAAGKEPAVAWVGSNDSKKFRILRIPDEGAKFGEGAEISAGEEYLLEDVFVDRARNEVYANVGRTDYRRFKDGGGKIEEVPVRTPDNWGLTIRVGPEGNIYGHAWGNRFFRWDRAGKPLPFKQSGKNELEIPSMMVYQLRGLHVDQLRGEILLVQPNGPRKTPECFGSVVRAYDLEGNMKREVIRSVNASSTVGPAVDAAGNVYIGEPSRPGKPDLPAFFKDKLPELKPDGENVFSVPEEAFPYSWAYGSIVKFSPQGGSLPWGNVAQHKNYKPFTEKVAGAANPVMFRQASWQKIEPVQSQGVLWAHGEFYPLPSRVACNCLASYFDVDYYGRSFYPDAARSRVGVLDTNGNVICRFGGYGNRDAKGEGGFIPLAMGLAVAASDRYIYIADICNHRLVRVKMTYAADETCAVR